MGSIISSTSPTRSLSTLSQRRRPLMTRWSQQRRCRSHRTSIGYSRRVRVTTADTSATFVRGLIKWISIPSFFPGCNFCLREARQRARWRTGDRRRSGSIHPRPASGRVQLRTAQLIIQNLVQARHCSGLVDTTYVRPFWC